MKILFLAFLSMDYVIYNNDKNHTYLALKHVFVFVFQAFKVLNLAFCFCLALLICILSVLTYSIILDILVIPMWEML